jgi:hypothetical protein
VTARELWRWQSTHERRQRAWRSPWLIAVAAGLVLHAPVMWRTHASAAAASTCWLAIALVAFAVAALRVPFHIYWRADASLLSRLPLEGSALVDVALVRCMRAAVATTVALAIAALPLAHVSSDVLVHELAIAGTLGICAAGAIPASAFGAAAIVALDRSAQAGAILGALPGVIATIVITACVLGGDDPVVLAVLVAASVVALIAARSLAPRVMPTILRDVSALDRQRLAPLEIREPTAIERAIAAMLGRGAIVYRKDARLMRRRYPLAFALGALAFLVLAIVAFARPDSQMTWVAVTAGGAALYAAVLARRLWRPPVELPRMTTTLPIDRAALTTAKLAWVGGWALVFVALPLLLSLAR